jgi:Suppressor of fused protein (SUFU)
MPQPTTPSPAEMYLNHLDKIFQQEGDLYQEESLTEGLPGVTYIVYTDVPEVGHLTALTYGLSLVAHPEWKLGRPELCICVESADEEWAHALGYIANQLRGECAFSYGDTINFGEPISEDSDMDTFFVFAPSLLDPEDYTDIEVGADYKINIACLYPMYSDEVEAYEKMGLEEFWKHPDFDNYSVNRPRISP